MPASTCDEPKSAGSSVTIIPLLANGETRHERLMPLVQKYPGSDTLGITCPPAHMQKLNRLILPRATTL